MDEIGSLFEETRESAGISLDEVSKDLNIEKVILENIEDGKAGAFSDMFKLKEYVSLYAKYLGLDEDKIIDYFNEYIFEATSKIPIKTIEKQVIEINKENEDRVASPYTKKAPVKKTWLEVLLYILLVAGFIVLVAWSVKTVVVDSKKTSALIGGNYELTK